MLLLYIQIIIFEYKYIKILALEARKKKSYKLHLVSWQGTFVSKPLPYRSRNFIFLSQIYLLSCGGSTYTQSQPFKFFNLLLF